MYLTFRVISNGKLNASQRLHSRPINQVVCLAPHGNLILG